MKIVYPKLMKYIWGLVCVFLFLLLFLFLEFFIFIKLGILATIIALVFVSVILTFITVFLREAESKKIEKNNEMFIITIVHKLKTSLAGFKWSLKMLLDEDYGHISVEQKNIIKKLYIRNNSIISSVHDLLDLTAIKDAAHSYNMVYSDIEEIIHSVMADYYDEAKGRKIDLSFKKSRLLKGRPLVKTTLDKDAIKSALQNIIDNAIKYTPPEGIVKVSLDATKKEIRIQVQDSGIGISKEAQKNIFQKFFRAGNAKKIDSSGVGFFP